MALLLSDSANLTQNDLQKGVIQTFIMQSVILDRIPLLPIEGNAYAYNAEATLPGVEFRAVNSAYSESTGTFNQKTETLVILGGDADVDKFIQQTRSNINDQRQAQTQMKIKSAVFKYQDTFINGNTAVDPNSFEGLKNRLTGTQVTIPTDNSGNGLKIIGSGENKELFAFFDKVDLMMSTILGGPLDALYMNANVRVKFRSGARRTNSWIQLRDDFGRPIDTYNGVPLLDIGRKADGSFILPLTETIGTSSVATSIYGVRFGQDESDQAVTGLTNGGIQVEDLGELQVKPALRTRIEFYTGLAVFGRGAARLTGVLNE
jgi:hypothetical protein